MRSIPPSVVLAAATALCVPTVADELPGSWIGVRLDGSAEGRGAAISRIFEDSPADRSGLRASDVIVELDGTPIDGIQDLIRTLRTHDPGSWLPLKVDRRGHEYDLRVRLGDRPTDLRGLRARSGWIGVSAIELPPALREHFGAPADAGVMISEVVAGGPAEAAGFELGDVVYQADGRPVQSVRALRERVAGGGVRNDLEFTVARQGAEIVLEARLEAKPATPAGTNP